MKINAFLFWERVKSLAANKKVSLKDMSKTIGLPYSTLAKQTSTDTFPPKAEQLLRMAEYFGIPVDELVYGGKAETVSPDPNADIKTALDTATQEECDMVRRILRLPEGEKERASAS